LKDDAHPARHGALILLLVSLVYESILLVFILRSYPAAAPSILGLPVDAQYPLQIWYQAPLFFATTALTAWVLQGVARLAGCECGFALAFGRIALATAVPFAMTTMLVESGVAVLMGLGVIDPTSTLRWLLGDGAWFANLYQAVGFVWLIALVMLAVRASGIAKWYATTLATVGLVLVYGLPVGLFIR
jgi:hypothetical protein